MNKIPFELTIISAHLQKNNANFFTKTRAYTVVSLIGSSDIPYRTIKTPVDKDGGENPVWGSMMKFYLEEFKLHGNSLMLVFMVRSKQTLISRDKNLGFAYVPLKELFEVSTPAGDQQNCHRNAAFLATTPSGKAKAVLYVSYKFGEGVRVEKLLGVGGKDHYNVIGTTVPSAPPLPPAPEDSTRFMAAAEGCFPEKPIPSAPYLEKDTDYDSD